MSNVEYIRKHKEDRPVVAIYYDFDKPSRLMICRRKGLFSLLGVVFLNSGRNPTVWREIMTWIKISPTCLQ